MGDLAFYEMQAADAVTAVLDGLSVALANSLQPGEEVTIESDSLTLVVERRTIAPPTDEASSGEAADAAALVLAAIEEEEGSGNANATRTVLSTPKALFVHVDDALKSDLAKFAAVSSVPMFLVPPTIEGLQGQVVDVQLVSYKASSRSPPPPPAETVGQPGELLQHTASPITSLTLRIAGKELKVSDSSEPILFTTQMSEHDRRGSCGKKPLSSRPYRRALQNCWWRRCKAPNQA